MRTTAGVQSLVSLQGNQPNPRGAIGETIASGLLMQHVWAMFSASYREAQQQSMQANELLSLCSTLHLFPHVLPSNFTLSFLSLVQYIHSAAAHVVPSYLLSRRLSRIVQFARLVHIWSLSTSHFFPSSLLCSLC